MKHVSNLINRVLSLIAQPFLKRLATPQQHDTDAAVLGYLRKHSDGRKIVLWPPTCANLAAELSLWPHEIDTAIARLHATRRVCCRQYGGDRVIELLC